jgi:hypothetical protein
LLWPARHAAAALFVGGSVLASAVVVLSLEQNREGVAATRWERNLAIGLAPFQGNEAVHFVVINTSGVNYISINPLIGAHFVQDKLNHFPARWSPSSLPTDSSIRILETQAAPPGYVGSWRVVFRRDVVIGALIGNSDPVPTRSVRIVRFDGEKVTPLGVLHPNDLVGLQADVADVED